MAMRLLGYAQKDVAAGSNWYDGYVASARTLGLLEGIPLSPELPRAARAPVCPSSVVAFTERRTTSSRILPPRVTKKVSSPALGEA